LILYGECYKDGIPHDKTLRKDLRNKVTNDDDLINNQMIASNSHMKLVEILENKYNIKTDIIISTYRNSLLSKLGLPGYDQNLLNIIVNDKEEKHDVRGLFYRIYQVIDNIKNNYKYLCFIRIDILLKQYFFNIIKSNYEKITLAHMCLYTTPDELKKTGKIHKASKCVTNHIMIIPKKYYKFLDLILVNLSDNRWNSKLWPPEVIAAANPSNGVHHNGLSNLIKNKLFTLEDFDVLINTFHGGDTSTGWNPLWCQLDRPIVEDGTLPLHNK